MTQAANTLLSVTSFSKETLPPALLNYANITDDLIPHNTIPNLLSEPCLADYDLELALYGHVNSGKHTPFDNGPADEPNLMEALDPKIEIIKRNFVYATVTLKKIHCRSTPIGPMLNGGTSLAIAECLAGTGSMLMVSQDKSLGIVGTSVSGNHVHMARIGERLRIYAIAMHEGRSSHLWRVEFYNDNNQLISSSTVTNVVIRGK